MMDKICNIFDKDFEYFVDEKTVNNVEENNGNISCQTGIVNNFPENLVEQIKLLIESNKSKDLEISELKKQLEKKK